MSACHLACHMAGRGCHLQENSQLHLKCTCRMPWQGMAALRVRGSAVGLGWGLERLAREGGRGPSEGTAEKDSSQDGGWLTELYGGQGWEEGAPSLSKTV